MDATGMVLTGYAASSTLDLDPGAGTVNATTSGSNDILVMKVDPSGNFVWGNTFGSTGSELGTSITLDASGNVYVTGRFFNTVDFDASAGDGILNANDLCPNTPAGFTVNNSGCRDKDGDGVAENTDPDDNNGCVPSATSSACNDSDGDGVLNAADLCPGTPSGAIVNTSGCRDRDGDGVAENTDPNDTNPCLPNGTNSQCDSDNDGVINGNDICPNTPAGIAVTPQGCADADGDGFSPELTGAQADPNDFNGCIPSASSSTCLDDDGDGVPNNSDQCPGTATGVPVNVFGCADADGDGFSSQYASTNPLYDAADNDRCIPNASNAGCGPTPKADIMPNYTFGNISYVVGDERFVIVNINEISGNATTGQVEFFIPNSAGFTYSFDAAQASATVITSEAVNNANWTITNTGTGMRFTSTTPISGNGRSRVAIKVMANTAGASANFTTNVTGGSGGETNNANNIAVLALSVQN